MRKRTLFILGAILILLLAACSRNLTDKSRIISLFRKNESTFLSAVETGDFSAVSRLRGIREITTRGDEGEIEFFCGGRGLIPASSYYGILYVSGGEEVFLRAAEASPEWSAEGAGWRYRQAEGDNDFYYEPLGQGFYYYEEHY